MIRQYLKHKIRHWLFPHAQESYAQEGEDILLNRFLENQKIGFYIDIGAHHPRRFSNTHLLYQRGWRGINIEPTPGALELFNLERTRDINLGFAVNDEEGRAPLYIFNDKALNTLEKSVKENLERNTDYFVEEVINIQTMPLKKILDQYLPASQTIDLLTIDVEGRDYEVLKSNDWTLYKPKYILIESMKSSIQDALNSKITIFLQEKGYFFCAKTYNTLFFKLEILGESKLKF